MPPEATTCVVSSTNDPNCFVALPKVFQTLSKSTGPFVILELRPLAPAEGAPANIHLSWSWGFTNDGSVGIPRTLLELLPLRVGERVSVRVIKAPPVAWRIHVAPLTVDDSEIIECSQAAVEEAVPQQLRVAYRGLVFPLYVHRTVLVRLRVVAVEFPGDVVDPHAEAGCIGARTEMVVETRPRRQGTDSEANQSPKPAVVRLFRAPTPEPSTEAVLLACPQMLEAFQWAVGSTLKVTNLSSVAPELPSSSLAAQNNPVSEKARLAALHVEGLSMGRSHMFKVELASDDLEEALRLKGGVVLQPNPFPDFACVLAEPHPAPQHPNPPLPAPPPPPPPALGLAAVEAVYPAEVRRALDFLRAPHRHAPVLADVLDPPERDARGAAGPTSAPPLDCRAAHLHATRDFLLSTGANVHLVVCGGKGYGKTTLARAVVDACELYAVTVPCLRLLAAGKGPGQQQGPLAQLKKALYDAALHAPSVLILDDLDALVPAEVTGHDSKLDQLGSLFLDLAHGAAAAPSLCTPLPWQAAPTSVGVRILSLVSSLDALHPRLRASPLCLNAVALPLPTREQRRALLRTAAGRLGCEVADGVLDDVAGRTPNFAPLDLCHVLARAAKSGDSGVVSPEAVAAVLRAFTPASYEGIALLKVEASLAQVGGMKEAVRLLHEKLVLPNKFPALFERLPIPMQSGVLLYGPPGCGKTHLIRCVLGDAGLNCIAVNGPELLNKYIGASELRVREVFAKAAAARPCVVFFDEFDSIAPKRGHDSTGVTDRVVNQLLCQLDGVEDRTGIFVVAATSRPDLIDAALLRPGRLDKLVRCDMPDPEERAEILSTLTRDMVLDPTVDLQEVAERCEGMTPADLAGLLATAHLKAVHETLDSLSAKSEPNRGPLDQVPAGAAHLLNAGRLAPDALAALHRATRVLTQPGAGPAAGPGQPPEPPPVPKVTAGHLEAAFRETRPSLSASDVTFYAAVYDAFARPAVALKRAQRATLA
eukprot:EG_transcript_1924